MDDAADMATQAKHAAPAEPERSVKHKREGRAPSGPWHGALMSILLWLGFGWLLAYTMLDVPFLESIGSWNYVLLLGLVAVLSVIMRLWRADLRRFSGSVAAPARPTRG